MERPSGREIILALRHTMLAGLEELATETIVPSLYVVYLRSEDFRHFRPIEDRLIADARRVLDAELEKLNNSGVNTSDSWFRRVRNEGADDTLATMPMQFNRAERDWHILIQEEPEPDADTHFRVVGELALQPIAEYGAGASTRRISTTKRLRESEFEHEVEMLPPSRPVLENAFRTNEDAWAEISYEDESGAFVYRMIKREIVVGRRSDDRWADIRLDTSTDVSREHLHLRWNEDLRRIEVQDCSQLGTRIDGVEMDSDSQIWVPIDEAATLTLADTVELELRTLANRTEGS